MLTTQRLACSKVGPLGKSGRRRPDRRADGPRGRLSRPPGCASSRKAFVSVARRMTGQPWAAPLAKAWRWRGTVCDGWRRTRRRL